MRLLGLDFGSKTVGVAVSDELGLTGYRFRNCKKNIPKQIEKNISQDRKNNWRI